MLKSTLICVLALSSVQVLLTAAGAAELGAPDQTFAVGPVDSFHNQDYNADLIKDDVQDMAFRFTFTTPSAFQRPGYVILETGRYHIGTALLLVEDRLILLVGGDSSSPHGHAVLRVVSRALEPATRYQVVFCLELDEDRNFIYDDTRGLIYLDGEPAVDLSYPGSQVSADIRVSGVADWSGSGPGGYGQAQKGALYVEEGSPPTDFPGPGFSVSDGTLDSPLEFFVRVTGESVEAHDGPNILLLTADDMNWDTVGAFGVTPNLDRLASEGMVFCRAHVSIAVCQPSRQSLLTGLYPHNNGGEGFEPINPAVTTLVEILRDLGYRLGILSKTTHLAPASEFPWHTKLTANDLAKGRDPQRYFHAARTFMRQAVDDGRPFFLMANSNDPHRPYSGGLQEANKYSEAVRASLATPSRVYHYGEVPVPGFLPELPHTLTEIAQYYSSSRRCDDTVGRILDALDEVGASENTIVIFLSDNGIAVPFAKTNVWLHSTRTPLIVRWPGVVAPGSVDDRHFIVGADLMPTLLDALEVGHSLAFDGFSFLPLLQGVDHQPGRHQVVTVFHETSARRRYEMRAIQGERFGYIFNAWADGQTAFKNESQSGLSWNAMRAAGAGDPAIQARVNHFSYRVPEELYDYVADPDALHNLMGRAEVVESVKHARQELLNWMKRTADPLQDTFEVYVQANPLSSLAPELSPRQRRR